MLISHSHKFIFIHIYKVAGTSVRTALQRFSYPPSKKNKLKSFIQINPPIFSTDFEGHINARSLKAQLPCKIFNSYYKFAFVRNPWDWQVSLYHFALQTPEHHQHQLIKKMKSFDEYIDWRINEDLRLQKDFIYENDTLLVDFAGKMEQINTDIEYIRQKLRIHKLSLPHKNQSRHRNYREYYDNTTKRYIEEAFAEDISAFKYSF